MPRKDMRRAKLIKLKTLDGLFEVMDHVPVGTEYTVDLNSIFIGCGVNVEIGEAWERELIFMDNGNWFPTELLEIDGREERYENKNCFRAR